MNSNDSILNKINEGAEAVVAENIATAELKAREITANSTAKSQKILEDTKAKLAFIREDLIRRAVTVAGIDAKKIILEQKDKMINRAFDESCGRLAKIDDKAYLKMIATIVARDASDGDIVKVAKADKARVTDEFIQGIAKKNNISLTLSHEYGDFSGGIYLISKNYDKNYTFEAEVGEIKEDMVTEIASALFKE